MEGSMAQIALGWPRAAWLKRLFVKRPVDINKILALCEAEKRIEKMHMALDERRRFSSLL